MRIGKQWLDQLYYRHLEKQLSQQSQSHRQQSPVEYKQAKSIGILTTASPKSHMDVVNQFVQTLRKENRKVKILAYFDDKLEHPSFPYDYFGKKEVSLISLPKGSTVEQFKAQPFDILFNLCLEENLMLGYIAAVSKAKMRIGPYQEKNNAYNLMIDIPEGKGIKHFIKEAEKVLANIKSEEYGKSKV